MPARDAQLGRVLLRPRCHTPDGDARGRPIANNAVRTARRKTPAMIPASRAPGDPSVSEGRSGADLLAGRGSRRISADCPRLAYIPRGGYFAPYCEEKGKPPKTKPKPTKRREAHQSRQKASHSFRTTCFLTGDELHTLLPIAKIFLPFLWPMRPFPLSPSVLL